MFDDKYTRDKVYMVYFHSLSSNSSGWLNDTKDIVCFEHFMSHGLQFDNPVDAERAAQERLAQLKELYHRNNLSMDEFRYEYEIFTNVRYNDIEDSNDVVCLQWKCSGYDLELFTKKHNIQSGIFWRTVADMMIPYVTINECYVSAKKVEKGQYICYNKKTKEVWISDWDVSSGSDCEKNEYEYLKKKYSEVERFIELNKRYGKGE